jgi:hypothetical protein
MLEGTLYSTVTVYRSAAQRTVHTVLVLRQHHTAQNSTLTWHKERGSGTVRIGDSDANVLVL